MEELLFTEEEKKYFEARRLHQEKFGEPPMFIGFIDYSDENQVEMIYNAKKEREDKQYYVVSKDFLLIKKSTNDMILNSEKFLLQIKLLIYDLSSEKIENIRDKYDSLFL